MKGEFIHGDAVSKMHKDEDAVVIEVGVGKEKNPGK